MALNARKREDSMVEEGRAAMAPLLAIPGAKESGTPWGRVSLVGPPFGLRVRVQHDLVPNELGAVRGGMICKG